MNGDAELSSSLVRRYGKRIYINGDFTVGRDERETLKSLEFLAVHGDVTVAGELEELFYEKCRIFGEVKVGEKLIRDRVLLNVSRSMLEELTKPVNIEDCVTVKFQSDISPELIKSKVKSLTDCAVIRCTEEQDPVISLLATDCAFIKTKEEKGSSFLETICGAFDGKISEKNENESVINSATYTFR